MAQYQGVTLLPGVAGEDLFEHDLIKVGADGRFYQGETLGEGGVIGIAISGYYRQLEDTTQPSIKVAEAGDNFTYAQISAGGNCIIKIRGVGAVTNGARITTNGGSGNHGYGIATTNAAHYVVGIALTSTPAGAAASTVRSVLVSLGR